MSELRAFLSENAIKPENVKVVVSNRFLDEDKNPIAFELCIINNTEYENLVRQCKRKVPMQGNPKQTVIETDYDKVVDLLVEACVVYPNLNDVELQDDYKAVGAIDTAKKMLTPGEYNDLSGAIQQAIGFEVGMEDKIKKAKN